MTRAWNGCFGNVLLAILVLGCDAGEPIPPQVETNALFPGTELIEVARPAPGCVVAPQPVFEWIATGQRFVMSAVFESNISVTERTINNPESAVWAWHPGLKAGTEGLVQWSDGAELTDSTFVPLGPNASLEVGRPYIWAVWAWDDGGFKVTHSSPQVFFRVDTVPFVTCP